MRPVGQNESEPAQIVGTRFAINGNVIDFLQLEFRFLEAIIDRARRQTCPVVDPAKSFLFRRGNEFAIDKQTGRGIAVISVETKDVQSRK